MSKGKKKITARHIKGARLYLGLNQVDFGTLASVFYTTISRWENGKTACIGVWAKDVDRVLTRKIGPDWKVKALAQLKKK